MNFDTDLNEFSQHIHGKPWNKLRKKERLDAIYHTSQTINKTYFFIEPSHDNYKVVLPDLFGSIDESRLSYLCCRKKKYFTNGHYLIKDKAVADSLREQYFKKHPFNRPHAMKQKALDIDKLIPDLSEKTPVQELALMVGDKYSQKIYTVYGNEQELCAYDAGYIKMVKKYFPKANPFFVSLGAMREKMLVFMQSGRLKAMVMPIRVNVREELAHNTTIRGQENNG